MNRVLELIRSHIVAFNPSEVAADIFGVHYHAVANGKMPLVLFCAGASGKVLHNFLTDLGIHPIAFSDNNTALIGEHYCNLPVIAPDVLTQEHRESVILIASAAYQEGIKKQLIENGLDQARVLILNENNGSFDAQLKNERLLMLARNGEPTELWQQYCADQEKLAEAYTLLADDKSRRLYIERLALIASGYDFQSYKQYLLRFSEPILDFGYNNSDRLQYGGVHYYFRNDVITLQDHEIFIDGGAYTGDSTASFIQTCKEKGVQYDSIHCFEPDKGNFRQLEKNTADCREVHCYRSGLWNKKGTAEFISSEQTVPYCARVQSNGNSVKGITDGTIRTDSIDDLLADQKVSLIKLDIEGAEYAAVEGACKTLKQYAPKLAISVYHEIDDLYRIPLLIHSVQPDYKFHLRHLSNYFDDVILFATV